MIFLCLTVLAAAISWLQISMIKDQERVPTWKARKVIQAVLLALALAIFLFDTTDPASRMLFVLMAILCAIPPKPRTSFFGRIASLAEWVPLLRQAVQTARDHRKAAAEPNRHDSDGQAGGQP